MPEIVILGSAQDGGVPHAGCLCASCRLARADPSKRRLPASIGLLSGDEWALVDATSAFEEQLHALWSRRPSSAGHRGERYLPPESIILTHAHTGHYVGIWQLDRSVWAARGVRISAPPLTAKLLEHQEPWQAMVAEGHITIDALPWNQPQEVVTGIEIEPVAVPHRSEWPTDTASLVVRGPKGTALYIPDIDFWDEWDCDIVEEVARVDVAILDGSFWAAPTSADVPHPPILETMKRLQRLVDAGATRVIFTHLNHSNPALIEGGDEAQELGSRGFEIAGEGMSFEI